MSKHPGHAFGPRADQFVIALAIIAGIILAIVILGNPEPYHYVPVP